MHPPLRMLRLGIICHAEELIDRRIWLDASTNIQVYTDGLKCTVRATSSWCPIIDTRVCTAITNGAFETLADASVIPLRVRCFSYLTFQSATSVATQRRCAFIMCLPRLILQLDVVHYQYHSLAYALCVMLHVVTILSRGDIDVCNNILGVQY